MTLEFNGERFIPGMPISIEIEHMHRYVLASSLAKGKHVLDVASGEGYGSNLLAQVAASVMGVDISAEVIEHAQETYQRPNLEFRVGDCTQLPVDSSSIDVVVSFETIEHHDQHEAMLAEISRVLKPDGMLIISSPNKQTYSDIPGTHNQFHVKELYLDEFERLLRRVFSNVVLYGQRAGMSSVFAPLHATEAPVEHMCWLGDRLVSATATVSAIYFVALASKSVALPRLPTSVFEINRPAALNTELAPAMFETKMFWRAAWSEQYDGYAEERAYSQCYAVDGKRHVIQLMFPAEAGQVTRIRLDIVNALGVVDIHDLRVLDQSGAPIWKWSGDIALMQRRVQLVLLPGLNPEARSTVVSLGNDPWFELDLPGDVYELIQSGCALVIELTPYRLLDRLPFVLQHIAQQLASTLQGSIAVCPAQGEATVESLGLAASLEALKGLLQSTLAQRDQTIAQQGMQLSRLREEFIRAEAQLDLLKEVMLSGREVDRL
jgi:protein-L-isoaspartate O-methyltransferase